MRTLWCSNAAAFPGHCPLSTAHFPYHTTFRGPPHWTLWCSNAAAFPGHPPPTFRISNMASTFDLSLLLLTLLSYTLSHAPSAYSWPPSDLPHSLSGVCHGRRNIICCRSAPTRYGEDHRTEARSR
ncbi:hypothetical protein K491DRAFT_340837 [Lophiostoma macrostomum CBS 122681]|uniref:Uncharacterized protein n=1 Tax=Lophiostoma macrostomum CBS 122681 TaxID=1314788 RepID=A0A6A6TB52_9PLEO|nr:hypothetical protein K491DRAFT_340837 [Lophiostoma macrostomum CBS 122681]